MTCKSVRGISPILFQHTMRRRYRWDWGHSRILQFITATLATRNWNLWIDIYSKSANHCTVTVFFQLLFVSEFNEVFWGAYFTVLNGIISPNGDLWYSIEEEIKERIAAGNRAYHVHKKLFSSKLIYRNVKLQLYGRLIHPTETYASETWVLKENMINKLMSFERKIMRKIFDPTRTDDGCWRIKTN